MDTARMATELDAMINELPAVVTFGTDTFNAVATTSTIGADIEDGGFLPARDIAFNARRTATTNKVKVGSQLIASVEGVQTTYRVISVERSPCGQAFIFSCRSHRR